CSGCRALRGSASSITARHRSQRPRNGRAQSAFSPPPAHARVFASSAAQRGCSLRNSSVFRDYLRHAWATAAVAAAVALCAPLRASAANAYLSGYVMFQGKPVADALVSATGNNVQQTTKTDVVGEFRFSTLSPGSYALNASAPGKSGSLMVDLPAA